MRNERGFTLIEMITVCIVMGILMAIAIPQFLGAKSTTKSNEARAAGMSYSAAIAQFQADHGNKLPAAADMMTLSGMPAGPKNLMGKAYVKNLPSGVVEGRTGVSMDGTTNCGGQLPNQTNGTASGWVAYCNPLGVNSNSYSVRIWSRDNSSQPWKPKCFTGSAATDPNPNMVNCAK